MVIIKFFGLCARSIHCCLVSRTGVHTSVTYMYVYVGDVESVGDSACITYIQKHCRCVWECKIGCVAVLISLKAVCEVQAIFTSSCMY